MIKASNSLRYQRWCQWVVGGSRWPYLYAEWPLAWCRVAYSTLISPTSPRLFPSTNFHSHPLFRFDVTFGGGGGTSLLDFALSDFDSRNTLAWVLNFGSQECTSLTWRCHTFRVHPICERMIYFARSERVVGQKKVELLNFRVQTTSSFPSNGTI